MDPFFRRLDDFKTDYRTDYRPAVPLSEIRRREEREEMREIAPPPGRPVPRGARMLEPLIFSGRDGDVDIYDEQLIRETTGQCDIDGDRKVNKKDVNILTRYLLGMEDLDRDGMITENDKRLLISVQNFGDINKDGHIDQKDRNALSKKIRELDVKKDGSVDALDLKRIKSIIKKYDLSGDGKVKADDVEMLSRFILGDPDINGDGIADRRDYFLRFALASRADLNKDGVADERDLKVLEKKIEKGDIAREKNTHYPKPDMFPAMSNPGPAVGFFNLNGMNNCNFWCGINHGTRMENLFTRW